MEDIEIASTSSGSTNDREISRSNIFRARAIGEIWSNMESFYEDQIAATLSKIRHLDDEVWGKLIIMNRNKCIAKIYLRNPLIVLDGSKNGFDGQRIGIDHFENSDADDETLRIRSKLGTGILLKVDQNGNVWVKKTTKSPIIIQNIDKPGIASFGSEILKASGILEANVPMKIFDMKSFKDDFERATKRNDHEATKRLLFKTIIRISFIRNESSSLKTPCWCALINLIAMDLLTKLDDLKRDFIANDSISSSPNSSSDSFYAVPNGPLLSKNVSSVFTQVKNDTGGSMDEHSVETVKLDRMFSTTGLSIDGNRNQSLVVDFAENPVNNCASNWSPRGQRKNIQTHETCDSISSVDSTPCSAPSRTSGPIVVSDQEDDNPDCALRYKFSLILDQEGTVAWQIRPVAGSYMQLPLSGPQCSGGTPGPGPIFQSGLPPNVMVQQGPMGGVLLAGPPPNQPPHLHPAMSLPPGHPSAIAVGSVMGDPMGGPVHFTCFNLESRLSDMNRRLLHRPRELDADLLTSWCEHFTNEFFEDDATLSLSFHAEDGPKRYTIGRTLIPRYFRTMFEAGVTDLYYMVRSSSDMRHPTFLDCERVTVVTTHDSPYYMQVQTNGRLICEFAYPMPNHVQIPEDTVPRIKTWNFFVIDHNELVPRDELQNPAVMQNFDMCKSVTRHGILPAILNYLRLCYILEPMQELMAHYRMHEQAPNGQTMLSPQECLKRVVFQKYNLLRGAQPSSQPMMPPEEQPKQTKRRKRKGSSSGGTTTPTGPGAQQGKKKPVASPSPAIMPPMGMSASNVDVMVVLEPSLMGGEYGDEDERYIQRLENTQYDPAAANAQMTMSSPVTSVGGMLSNSMMPPHLQPDRSFDSSMVWPGGPPAHLQHHSASVSGPNTPIGRTTTPSLMMHPQLVSSPANMLGGGSAPAPLQQGPPSQQHQIIRQGAGMTGSQNGSRQSTPNATPTSF